MYKSIASFSLSFVVSMRLLNMIEEL